MIVGLALEIVLLSDTNDEGDSMSDLFLPTGKLQTLLIVW